MTGVENPSHPLLLLSLPQESTKMGEEEGQVALPHVGRLVNLEWKLGVTVASNTCHKIEEPFVVLKFQIEDNNEQLQQHSIQLSIAEFTKMAKSFSEMHTLMESL